MLEGVSMDEDVTLAGETAQVAFIDETMMSELEDDADLAWSAEEHVVDIYPRRRHWPLWAALVLVLCLVTGAAVWLATVFYQQQWGATSSTAETPTVVTPTPPPAEVAAPKSLPAPGPPALHEQPPAPAAPPDPDQQFLALISEIPGVTITNPQLEINETKVVCAELRDGASRGDIIAATLREAPTLTKLQAEQLFDAGTTIYCPEFSRR